MLKANVYIDSFNLYYGCLKNTPYRWLNLGKLSARVLPNHFTLNKIRFYTARVTPLAHDPDAPTRQAFYLRAVATIPNLSIHYGHFLKSIVPMPLARPQPGGPTVVKVIKTEEKGSDVNLASHMLLDAFTKDCDVALVISNDSDLLEPIRIARAAFGMLVGLVSPHPRPATVLRREVDFIRHIRTSTLKQCQFPATLTDAAGSFSKPATW